MVVVGARMPPPPFERLLARAESVAVLCWQFGQVVIGPPGSGKTTYCVGMCQYLQALGRKVAVINLDPANDNYTYPVAADIKDLILLDAAAAQCELGPNGALVYCYEFLEANTDWLLEKLAQLSDCYVLLDMPGQVELYTHHASVRNILQTLTLRHNHRLVAVHLVDAHHCADAAKFISVLLVTLSTMVQLEMPQVNLLSKIDLVEAYGELAYNLDFYTDVTDPSRLLPYLQQEDSAFARRHAKLNEAICELIDDFSLVQFGTLDISSRESVGRALKAIDKANGYVGSGGEGPQPGVHSIEGECDDDRVGSVQERYMAETDLGELLGPHAPAARRRTPP